MSTARGPWIVAGMHRSGTSLVASALASAGIDPGDRLLPADARNQRGYFEDLDFLDLNRRMLAAACAGGTAGHPDWGWTEDERLDPGAFIPYRDEAQRLVASRDSKDLPWGFKDPRAALLLDFWLSAAPDARFVLPYRLPWEVADSMQRLGSPVFLRHPDYAYRIWAFYNRHLLDFHRRHPERTLLLSVDAAVADGDRLGESLTGLGLSISPDALSQRFEPGLFHRLPSHDPLISLVAAAHPECIELLRSLDEAAALPSTGLWVASPPAARRFEQEPAVTVIIPCFEDGELAIEAIASVERAVETPYELIVIDDGSSDPRTSTILDMLRAGGYDVRSRPHGGLAKARNYGFEMARAPFIIPLDADNRLLPGFVKPALDILEREERVAAAYGDRMEFGTRSRRVAQGPLDLDRITWGNHIDACAVIRRQAWQECGGYDESMPLQGSEDWDLWLTMIRRGWTLQWLELPGFEYRVRPDSMLHALKASPDLGRVMTYVTGKHQELILSTLQRALVERDASRTRTAALTAELADCSLALEQSESERVRIDLEREKALAEMERLQEEGVRNAEELRRITLEVERLVAGEIATRQLLSSEIDRLRESLTTSDREGMKLIGQVSELKDAESALRKQALNLHTVIEAWREKVRAIESTRLSQLRRTAIRLRSRIVRRPRVGPAYPCVIGATGGSGTRVFARVAAQGGLALGQERNACEDALEIERFLDRWLIPFWKNGGNQRPHPSPPGMDEDLAATLAGHFAGEKDHRGPRGWKSPRSLYLLPFWAQRFPDLRFLHLVRDGRDMALSTNQLQLGRYSSILLSPAQQEWSEPERSIALWCLINGWAAEIGERLGPAYLRVRFEDLCDRPTEVIARIYRFFDLPGNGRRSAHLVEPPESLGRWRLADPRLIARLEEIGGAVLRRFGYPL